MKAQKSYVMKKSSLLCVKISQHEYEFRFFLFLELDFFGSEPTFQLLYNYTKEEEC